MRSLATKQPSNQDSARQKPVRANPAPVAQSLSIGLTGSAMLQRKPDCACGGGCPRCQEAALLQTKLKISEPGDEYEQEADRVAEQVMRMPEPSVQRQVEPREKEEEMFQRQAISNSITPLQRSSTAPNQSSEVPEIVHEVLRSPGQSLDPATRALMEPRFGHDFSQVRVHTGGDADRSARDVNARAYTVGNNIVFGASQFVPRTHEGRRLLAHELTHVVQQNSNFVQQGKDRSQGRRTGWQLMGLSSLNQGGILQRQPTKQGTPNTLDPEAEKIMQIAQNEKSDLKMRAVQIVYLILSHFYPSESSKVGAVGYDDSKAEGGLQTESYLQQSTKIYYGHIVVGKKFVERVANKLHFAHAVSQVGHELKHIDQYRSGMVGSNKQPEREFLAFHHEALATELPGSGRLQHSTRARIIDVAIGYYYCLSSGLQNQYTDKLNELLQRRPKEIKNGYERKEPPTSCEKQP
jgi:hypothetical protein